MVKAAISRYRAAVSALSLTDKSREPTTKRTIKVITPLRNNPRQRPSKAPKGLKRSEPTVARGFCSSSADKNRPSRRHYTARRAKRSSAAGWSWTSGGRPPDIRGTSQPIANTSPNTAKCCHNVRRRTLPSVSHFAARTCPDGEGVRPSRSPPVEQVPLEGSFVQPLGMPHSGMSAGRPRDVPRTSMDEAPTDHGRPGAVRVTAHVQNRTEQNMTNMISTYRARHAGRSFENRGRPSTRAPS